MSVSIKSNGRDEVRIGEYAAKQPLSGTHVVDRLRVVGISGSSFVRLTESKKAS
jgi:hypothetical protein